MIDKRITPQVMCSACGHVFPTLSLPHESSPMAEEITCPECKTHAKPKGVMQPTGFPSLDIFKRNWQRSKSIDVVSTEPRESLLKSSGKNKE